MQRTIYSILLIGFTFLTGFAQSPPELKFLIDYDSNPNVTGNQFDRVSIAGIAAGFNNGRRNEESQFFLAPNTLGFINIPSQTDWDSWSSSEKIIHLLNEERTARAGVDYLDGVGPVKGLPITGVEQSLNNIAQTYAQNFTISTPSFSSALDANPILGGTGCTLNPNTSVDCCHDLLAPNNPSTGQGNPPGTTSYTNSIAGFSLPLNSNGMPFPGIEVRAVYKFVFDTDNRLVALMQDEDLNATTGPEFGYGDDYGDIGDEGFMGVGIHHGQNSAGVGLTYVAFVFMDPVPESEGCNYNCITCTPCPNTISVNSIPFQDGVIQAENTVTAQGLVPSSGDVKMKAGDYVELNPVFEVASGGIFHAYIDGCYFTLD